MRERARMREMSQPRKRVIASDRLGERGSLNAVSELLHVPASIRASGVPVKARHLS